VLVWQPRRGQWTGKFGDSDYDDDLVTHVRRWVWPENTRAMRSACPRKTASRATLPASASQRSQSNGTSSGVFGSFPVPIAGKTGTAEKVVNLPGYPVGHLEDQAWWCGWGPFDGNDYTTSSGAKRTPIVVCAVIENGGHGGTVAAPAALKVFESWFREHAGVQGVVASD